MALVPISRREVRGGDCDSTLRQLTGVFLRRYFGSDILSRCTMELPAKRLRGLIDLDHTL